MFFNYINFNGHLKILIFNGLFLKNFLNFFFFYQFLIYYNKFYKISNSSQKSRSFVNFSTKKIFNQKGRGKSRVGSASSPTRIGGSKSFPNFFYIKYNKNFNKNLYRLSFFIVYSNLFLHNYFILIDDFFFIDFKSKTFKFFFNFNYLKKSFFLTLRVQKNFFLSVNNFKFFKIFYFFNFNPILLLKFSNFLITKSCLEYFFLND